MVYIDTSNASRLTSATHKKYVQTITQPKFSETVHRSVNDSD